MTARRYLPALLLLFVGSGCAALIYEVVWFQLLQLDHRVVGRFDGGSARHVHGRHVPGQLLLPRLVSARAPPAEGVRVPRARDRRWSASWCCSLMPALSAASTRRSPAPASSASFCAASPRRICLLPPTLLMGATLPAMARWVETTPDGVSWLGFFYGGNIAGAVLGSLTAGFYLLRVHDMAFATFVAVGLNVLVAGDRAGSSRRSRTYEAGRRRQTGTGRARERGAWAIYVAIGISGMTALAAEVIWTRMLSLLSARTVYTFSLILAVFLLGLGIGSSVGSACRATIAAAASRAGLVPDAAGRRDRRGPRTCSTQSLPYWPIDPSMSSSPWYTFQLDLVRTLWAMLPGGDPLGRELSARAGLGCQRPPGPGAAGGRRLRRQHRRRDRRRAHREPVAGRVARAASARSRCSSCSR